MSEKVASMKTFYGLPGNKFGLIDKTNQAQGLSEVNLETSDPVIGTRTYLNFFDTRSCIGELSLFQARLAFAFNAASEGMISPREFKSSLEPDNRVNLKKLISICSNLNGFPERNSQNPYIDGNTIYYPFQRSYKWVHSLDMINTIIPRDIIPIYVYFPSFIENCLLFKSPDTGESYINPLNSQGIPSSTWESPIPQTIESFIDNKFQGLSSYKLGGIYETPLRYWRTYTGPNAMPNAHTPPPYQLWNPPQDSFSDDPWPFQEIPKKGQRIPTYRARNGVIFSGYGLYDLDDFPPLQEVQIGEGNVIQVPLRKLILKLIVPKEQYINGISAEELIDISNDDDFNDTGIVDNPLTQTGYGDYQRFIPGPGIGSSYQPNQWRPGKSAPIELSLSTYDPDSGTLGPMPVPFPNFRGNTWGPYSRPGDRFQNLSLQATIDELYLNGDLDNMFGNPILFPGWNPSLSAYTFQMYSLMLKRPLNSVRFQAIETCTNLNITNSMRVTYDGGFGAVFAYVGKNAVSRGFPGPIITGGLPNTQYDGTFHPFNPDKWIQPRETYPTTWLETLPGPQRPDITKSRDSYFPGWIYSWRNIYPYTGQIYVPCTAGGSGPMSTFDGTNWIPEEGTSSIINYTYGSSQWSKDPVIGLSKTWCIPRTDKEFPQTTYVSNVPWGLTSSIEPCTGGTRYSIFKENGITRIVYIAKHLSDVISNQLTINNVDTQGTITEITGLSIDKNYVNVPATIISSSTENDQNATVKIQEQIWSTILTNSGTGYSTGIHTIIGGDNNAEINIITVNGITGAIETFVIKEPGTGYLVGNDYNISGGLTYAKIDLDYPNKLVLTTGGYGYSVTDGVSTYNNTGTGNGLTIDILEVDLEYGSIIDFSINDPGTGYKVDDIVTVVQVGSGNNATFKIKTVLQPLDEPISQYNQFQYHDPIATGPANVGTTATLANNYVDAPTSNTVTNDFYIGNVTADYSNGNNLPTVTPNPPNLASGYFFQLPTPEQQYTDENSDRLCRPDNERVNQSSNYTATRVAYRDMGSGTLLASLMTFRTFFISSTQDTDVVIRIKNAERDTYMTSASEMLSGSNLYTPIRLNLGTSSGTVQYIEAPSATLAGSGEYWVKKYEPPLEQLDRIELSFFTYNGTPIPLERCLGVNEQIKGYASLFTATISSAFTVHGSYEDSIPNLPPFVGTFSNSPSSILISAVPSSKSLSEPFNPFLENYVQRNFGSIFKIVCYHPENPGTTEIIKKIPGVESFTEKNVPLASNIDEYSQ